MRRFLLGIMFVLGGVAWAEHDSRLQYNFVQLNYYTINPNDSISGVGKGVDGNIPWGKRLPIYTLIRFRDFDNDYQDRRLAIGDRAAPDLEGEVGLGAHMALTSTLDITFSASFYKRMYDEDNDGNILNETNNGTGLHLGVRHLLLPSFEWGAELAQANLRHDDEFQRQLYGLWHLNKWLGLGGKYFRRDTDTIHNLFMRISF